MSKKKVHTIARKDSFCRMNFLYQASMLYAGKNNTLSSYYGALCRSIGKKSVLHSDPNLKRNICKRCCLGQEPGITAELNIETQPPRTGKRRRKRRKNKRTETNNLDENAKVTLKCMQCENQRTFHINSNYTFWLENPNSVAELYSLDRRNISTHNDHKNNSKTTDTLNNESSNVVK